ncbi:MAG: preprotein translocase [Burkholderiales bacterium 66-5]|nr:MAG: preprotein translocase [Burkholderiales bacterium 66-5]
MPTPKSRTRLTAGRVDAFTCPPGKSQAFLWDSDAPCLLLRAAAGGRKTYVFEARLNGKTIRQSIGDVKSWALAAARTEAQRLKMVTDTGQDVRETKRQQQAEREAQQAQQQAQAVTVGDAWASYIEARRPHWGALHLRDNVDMMAPGGKPMKRRKGTTAPGLLACFAPMQLADVTPERVQQWAEREGKTRPTNARLALRLLRAFLNWCTEQPQYAPVVTSNATKGRATREALGKAQAKSDALLKEQLPAFFAAVLGLNPTVRAYLLALLLTGARTGELLGLRWDDVNTQWKSLSIRDKDESKGGKDGTRLIPLTPYVHHLIAGLPRRSEWVFSSDTLAQPISRPNHRLADVCKVAGIEHLTLHGLRRSFGSLAEWLELPAGVIAQIQGHKPSATAEKHYRVRPLDLLRLHHEKFEAWILEQAVVQFDAQAEPGKLRAVATK